MSKVSPIAEIKLPQVANIFCQVGDHEKHAWIPLPWKGVFNKVLYFDPITGAVMELAKVEKGCSFPAHYHTTLQTLFLVSGRLRDESGAVTVPGTFRIIPAGQLHGPFVAEEEAIQFKYFSSVPVYILKDGTTYIYQFDGKTTPAGKLDFVETLKDTNFISQRKYK
jgi:quercetin dioxygenase-like cupin family protein